MKILDVVLKQKNLVLSEKRREKKECTFSSHTANNNLAT
jgi:hypothetical protein